MRILSIIAALAVTAFAASSCGILSMTPGAPATGTPSTNVSAVNGSANGQAAGAALKALYAQYKADGNKLNMSNLQNILNLTTLATNVQGLKGQSDKGTFYKDFAKGLVLGSNNLVTESNSTSVMSGLTNLVNNVDLSALTASAEEKAQSAASTLTEKLAGASDKANTAVENATEIAGAVTNILNLFK